MSDCTELQKLVGLSAISQLYFSSLKNSPNNFTEAALSEQYNTWCVIGSVFCCPSLHASFLMLNTQHTRKRVRSDQ